MDMANTLTALVNASSLPLSLLIVGVGRDDFHAMHVLDGDQHRIRAPDGRYAARDSVQFVEFRPEQVRPVHDVWESMCMGVCNPPPPSCTVLQRDTVESLAAKLLAELPGQVVEYHDMRGISPSTMSMPPPAVAAASGPHPAEPAGAAASAQPAVAAVPAAANPANHYHRI